jgi:hypothetical protein
MRARRGMRTCECHAQAALRTARRGAAGRARTVHGGRRGRGRRRQARTVHGVPAAGGTRQARGPSGGRDPLPRPAVIAASGVSRRGHGAAAGARRKAGERHTTASARRMVHGVPAAGGTRPLVFTWFPSGGRSATTCRGRSSRRDRGAVEGARAAWHAHGTQYVARRCGRPQA